MVIFTKVSMDLDKPFPEENKPPVRFIGEPPRQVRAVIIQESWYPYIYIYL